MNKGSYKIALLQTSPGATSENNIEIAREQIREAAQAGAKLICLPELFNAPYFCQVEDDKFFKLAEPITGPSIEAIKEVARETQTVVVTPFFERKAPGLYFNSAAVIDSNGEVAGHYRKMHIPDDPGFYEKYYFTPGDLGFEAFDTSVGKIGVLICWDQWFPEGARITALKGAEVLIYPTAIGWHPKEKNEFGVAQHSSWETIQRSHAIANGVFVASINRFGHEVGDQGGDGIEFWGQSFFCDPQGMILEKAPVNESAILYSTVDPVKLETVRQNWPFLRDRRIDGYQPITSRYLDPN